MAKDRKSGLIQGPGTLNPKNGKDAQKMWDLRVSTGWGWCGFRV